MPPRQHRLIGALNTRLYRRLQMLFSPAGASLSGVTVVFRRVLMFCCLEGDGWGLTVSCPEGGVVMVCRGLARWRRGGGVHCLFELQLTLGYNSPLSLSVLIYSPLFLRHQRKPFIVTVITAVYPPHVWFFSVILLQLLVSPYVQLKH